MCPALAEQGGRPWFAHGSRVFTFSDDWLAHLLLLVTPAFPLPPAHVAAPAPASSSASVLSWTAVSVPSVTPTPAPSAPATSTSFLMVQPPGQSYVTATDSGIANLADVAEADSCDAWTVAESIATAPSAAASSSCSTGCSLSSLRERPHRWTKYNKKE